MSRNQYQYLGIRPPTEQMCLHPPRSYYALVDRAGIVQNYRGTVVYLWLTDNRELWFFMDFCSHDTLTGCYWDGQTWSPGQIPVKRILAYC